jgi:hypothetical protein
MPATTVPRFARILIARGRDATDVAISTSFGTCQLTGFKVLTDDVRLMDRATQVDECMIRLLGWQYSGRSPAIL